MVLFDQTWKLLQSTQRSRHGSDRPSPHGPQKHCINISHPRSLVSSNILYPALSSISNWISSMRPVQADRSEGYWQDDGFVARSNRHDRYKASRSRHAALPSSSTN